MTSTSKVIVGILGAAAAGVVLGMLIAPEKGSDLRRNLKNTTDDWLGEITEWMGKGKKYLADIKDQAEGEAEGLAAEAEQGVNSLKESARRRASTHH
ncbi:YtxH domain-containing protein [Parachryseolinea silvisoli]|jgi:gas vesicle protein|uniref:YtxH domain-containing protein n=1 Tax=Parachryseolinea silvisoli TaxID=2873601 RepID=UPI0022658800|nr:YtxH domain-containing protein [Parachryseolinea silvisoli]MCD9019382.1 YtxH domain-containing protein [Parachryseolinea silvisoli]